MSAMDGGKSEPITAHYVLTLLPARSFLERRKMSDKKWLWLARKLPRKLVYWCVIRLLAYATSGSFSNQIVPELTIIEALNRWDVQK